MSERFMEGDVDSYQMIERLICHTVNKNVELAVNAKSDQERNYHNEEATVWNQRLLFLKAMFISHKVCSRMWKLRDGLQLAMSDLYQTLGAVFAGDKKNHKGGGQ